MPRLGKRQLAGLAGLAIAGAAFAGSSAGARGVDEYESKVTISKNPPAFHGQVLSDYHPCVNHRHVALFRKRPGDDVKLGGDQTGPAGRWKVELEILASGEYYARVRQRQQMAAAGSSFICEKDVSRVLSVD
jgi:hypothetical protein